MTATPTRDDLGRWLYEAYAISYFVIPWDDLPDHDQQRFINSAVDFLKKVERRGIRAA